MNINTIGAIIKKRRESCGLTQAALAAASHVSRVTVANLENGKSGDIGVIKLSEIAENVGAPLFSLEGGSMDFIKINLGNVNTSYKTTMTRPYLEEFMRTGVVQPGFEGQILHFIDETPISMITGAVRQFADTNHVKAKLVWKTLSRVAKEIKSPNKFWSCLE